MALIFVKILLVEKRVPVTVVYARWYSSHETGRGNVEVV